MGYTTASTSMFSPDIKQTPENVRKVLDIAGWTVREACEEIGCGYSELHLGTLPNNEWLRLLDKAGRRSCDHDEDSLE